MGNVDLVKFEGFAKGHLVTLAGQVVRDRLFQTQTFCDPLMQQFVVRPGEPLDARSVVIHAKIRGTIPEMMWLDTSEFPSSWRLAEAEDVPTIPVFFRRVVVPITGSLLLWGLGAEEYYVAAFEQGVFQRIWVNQPRDHELEDELFHRIVLPWRAKESDDGECTGWAGTGESAVL